MLLQPINPKLPPNYPHQNHTHFHSSNALSFSSGLSKNSSFFLKQPINLYTSYETHKIPVFINCSSASQAHNYGAVDFERRPMSKWNVVCKKISTPENAKLGPSSVLNEAENEGNRITKWELSKVVKELRKFRRYKLALEVYKGINNLTQDYRRLLLRLSLHFTHIIDAKWPFDSAIIKYSDKVYEWMNNRPERFRTTTSDTAIQLDLISKVNGISTAEQYFKKLPDALKDMRIYGSLLNAYVRAKMREEAETIMDKMRNKNYCNHALLFNVMMTLYVSLKDHDKIETVISEMTEKGIALDTYSYNIWLSSRGSRGSLEEMEEVFQRMELDNEINPNWTTFSTMATMYIKSGQLEKADECLKKIESRITSRDRIPYHCLINLYGGAGNKEEVHRIWNNYKGSFANIPNLGYHTMISALVRMDDIEGAERIYNEWLLVKSYYDPRIGNLLLNFYVRNGLSQEALALFDQMIEVGGKPNSMTWEILSEDHIRNKRISEALPCFKKAASAEGPKVWKPKPMNVSKILEIAESKGDVASKDALLEILRDLGCYEDAGYMSYIPVSGGGAFVDTGESDEVNDGDLLILDQIQESL